ncbi:MAG: ABC transporter ATP-binding protein [Pseudomonadota bacterium]
MADGILEVRLQQSSPIPLAVELSCAPGEILALAGPSGSGKSTVLRSIAGLYHPAKGRIACQGEPWFDSEAAINLPPYRRASGLVFQSYALFPHLTALQNVTAALGHLPHGHRESRAKELLRRVHLAGLENRRPAMLSGGQQQRVAVARALARDPQTLLLDEPFSAVDQVTRRRLYRELAELRRSLSMPIILVTHDLEEASVLADRLCMLHRGRTLQTGTPTDMAARPASALVARLMDRHNLFTGVVTGHDSRRSFTFLRWRGLTLEARHRPDLPSGRRVSWMIPEENVILHRRDRPSRGERENPVSGTIVEAMAFGERTTVLIETDIRRQRTLMMTVPTHVARRNTLGPGVDVTVSLLAEGIHLMPYEVLRKGRPN